jgi:hypothetical protein
VHVTATDVGAVVMRMSWDEALDRISKGEPVEDVLDEKSALEEQDFRAYLAGMGERGIDALRRYDARMRNLNTGITGARSAWHSISQVQRTVLLAVLKARPGRIVRRSVKPSIYTLDGQAALLCRIATLRNLCERNLLAWDGGAFDPEMAAVVTERGAFVAAHGQLPEGARWDGS